ncbi:MAG: hypothetical protein AB2L14_01280 [Candidatus Xenobiia bacterium LiM19]
MKHLQGGRLKTSLIALTVFFITGCFLSITGCGGGGGGDSSSGYSGDSSGGSAVVPSPSPSASVAETWSFKGFALGQSIGNETNNSFMPDVIRLDNGLYRMYYGHSSPSENTIKYAESADGINWTVMGAVLQGSSDANDREYIVTGPSVVRLPDGRYRMYYQSSTRNSTGQMPKLHVRSAISGDGVNFTREGVRIDISAYDSSAYFDLAGHGSYYIAADGSYVGIFSGNRQGDTLPSSLFMGTSADGLTFGNYVELYKKWHDPIIINTGGAYVLYATYLLEKQGKASSTDGLTWSSEMTEVAFVDANGSRMTEASSGVGDISGLLMPSGNIRLYTNYGTSGSTDIVYFDKK